MRVKLSIMMTKLNLQVNILDKEDRQVSLPINPDGRQVGLQLLRQQMFYDDKNIISFMMTTRMGGRWAFTLFICLFIHDYDDKKYNLCYDDNENDDEFHNTITKLQITWLLLFQFCIFSVSFSQDSQELLCGANDGFIYLYDRLTI